MIEAGENAALKGSLGHGDWHRYQKFVLAIVACAVMFDGMDNQLLSFAIPALIADWGVARSDFSPILALGFVGMSLGTMVGGALGDRIGRRTTLIAAVSLFGLATLLIAFTSSLLAFGALRTASGFGLGAAMPVATALAAEFTPLKRRSLAVALTIVCIPVGGLLGGVVASWLLPGWGWKALFLVGGAAPVSFAILLWIVLPESPVYLASRESRAEELARLLHRMNLTSAEDPMTESRPQAGQGRMSRLLAPSYLRDTLALWSAFFMCLLSIYTVFSWLPALLTSEGFDIAQASSSLAIFNLGGIGGSIMGALAIQRFGSKSAMLALTLGAILSCLVLVFTSLENGPSTGVYAGLLVSGAFMNSVQTALYGLSAHVYPGDYRAPGIGAAAAIGRLGAIASAYIGAAFVAAGSATYFGGIAATLAVTFLGLALLRRHSPPTTS